MICLQNMRKSEQEAILWPLLEKVDRVCIDATGLGIGWADDAQDKFGEYKVEARDIYTQGKRSLGLPGPLKNGRSQTAYSFLISMSVQICAA